MRPHVSSVNRVDPAHIARQLCSLLSVAAAQLRYRVSTVHCSCRSATVAFVGINEAWH